MSGTSFKGKTYEEIYGKERGLIEKQKRNNSKRLKELYSNGKLQVWNVGLTKKTDYRILQGIKTKLKNDFKKRVNFISDFERSIIIGTLLGDGHLDKSSYSVRFQICHSLKQKNYLLWKLKKGFRRFKCKVFINEKYNRISFNTEKSPLFLKFYKQFYKNKRKILPKKLLFNLTNLSLAVWFMDDGFLNLNAGGGLCSDGFSFKENKIIQEMFLQKGINCKIRKRNTKTYFIYFNNKNFDKLLKLIKKNIYKDFFYKIDTLRRYRKP